MRLLESSIQTKTMIGVYAFSIALHASVIFGMGWIPFLSGGALAPDAITVSILSANSSSNEDNRRRSRPIANNIPNHPKEMRAVRDVRKSSNPRNSEAVQKSAASTDGASPLSSMSVTQWPRVIREKKAEYPAVARKNGIAGTVALKVRINELGEPDKIEILNGPGQGLNEAAAAALKEYRFSPAYVATQPVAVSIIYRYNFEIR